MIRSKVTSLKPIYTDRAEYIPSKEVEKYVIADVLEQLKSYTITAIHDNKISTDIMAVDQIISVAKCRVQLESNNREQFEGNSSLPDQTINTRGTLGKTKSFRDISP